jgi:pimeloyl-ACP methyl ester carboxylesterase
MVDGEAWLSRNLELYEGFPMGIASGATTNRQVGGTRREFLAAATSVGVTALLARRPVFGGQNSEINPFTFRAPESALDDLKQRLKLTRWPERETVDDWSQGVPLADLKKLVEYWRTEYDWRRCEKALHQFPQFRTEIDGLGIHFIHVRSKHTDALPLILTHGWPSTVLLFRDVIGRLTDPTAHDGSAEDAFHVVVPSLPGFGFSDKPKERGWNARRTANAWATLMQRLGYKRYVAQGGDWGAYVTTAMAQQRPPGLAAIHLNFPQVIPDEIPEKLTPEQQRAMKILTRFQDQDFGYFAIQGTRPQTIGYALMDSPAGFAGWLYDIYRHHATSDLNWDTILDEITLYWLTGTAASSARFYFEQVALLGKHNNPGRVELPVGCSIFPRDLPAPRSWAELVYSKLIYWNELDRGGHFAALEEPALFAREIRAFAGAVRKQ